MRSRRVLSAVSLTHLFQEEHAFTVAAADSKRSVAMNHRNRRNRHRMEIYRISEPVLLGSIVKKLIPLFHLRRESMNTYSKITERIIRLLEKGIVPWHKPWKGTQGIPRNLVSDKEYRGINVFVLSAAAIERGFDAPYWLTYRQARQRRGYVKKDEKGEAIVFWNWREVEDEETGIKKKMPFLRCYTVFNVEQCEGIEYPQPEETPLNEFQAIKQCEQVVSNMPAPPQIRHGGTKAYYRSNDDLVSMPKKQRFESSEKYYSTLFHELVHSTGHLSRLNRKAVARLSAFGSAQHSREELIAEIGAAFLCGHCAIENKTLENSTAYVNAWLRELKQDKRLVVFAAANAQKAVDYVLGK